MATSDRMPTVDEMEAMEAAYRTLSPHPDHYDAFLRGIPRITPPELFKLQ